jgi:hypothetical protein
MSCARQVSGHGILVRRVPSAQGRASSERGAKESLWRGSARAGWEGSVPVQPRAHELAHPEPTGVRKGGRDVEIPKPVRDVALPVKDSPDVHPILMLKLEDQTGRSLQRPNANTGKTQFVRVPRRTRLREAADVCTSLFRGRRIPQGTDMSLWERRFGLRMAALLLLSEACSSPDPNSAAFDPESAAAACLTEYLDAIDARDTLPLVSVRQLHQNGIPGSGGRSGGRRRGACFREV